MNRREFLTATGVLLLAEVGCDQQQVVDQSPAAKKPVLTTLSTVVPSTCAWTDAAPNVAVNWEILPSGHPTGDLRVKFKAPYPTTLQIDIDGHYVISQFDNTLTLENGYYKIDSINLASTQDTFDWDITVTPPVSLRMEIQFRLNIADVSINPNYSG